MSSKQLTKEEIIRETASFYTSKNRAWNDKLETCCYTDNNGNHCAVGRCMLVKGLPRINSGANSDAIEVIMGNYPNIDHLLKKRYRGHGFVFWHNLQRLHDKEDHWTDDGVSDAGKKFVLDTFGVQL